MSNPPNRTGHEPQLSNNAHSNTGSGLEPQLGGEQRHDHRLVPVLLRFVTQISGESGLSYRLEDSQTGKARVQLQNLQGLKLPCETFEQLIALNGQPYLFQSTGLSAQLISEQGSWHIDYVKGLSGATRIEWALRDPIGLPVGVMRLNRMVGWLELVLADNRMVCKTAITPHHGGIEEIIVRTDRITARQEPLFLTALLFGLAVALDIPRYGL